jgi:hypothetical protein
VLLNFNTYFDTTVYQDRCSVFLWKNPDGTIFRFYNKCWSRAD